MLLSKTGQIVLTQYTSVYDSLIQDVFYISVPCKGSVILQKRIRVPTAIRVQSSINFNVLIQPIMHLSYLPGKFRRICWSVYRKVIWFLTLVPRLLTSLFLCIYHVLTIPTFHWSIRLLRFTRFCRACTHSCKPISCFIGVLLIWMYVCFLLALYVQRMYMFLAQYALPLLSLSLTEFHY